MNLYINIFLIGLIFRVLPVSPFAEIQKDDEVLHLIGEPDFRDVRLHWEYGRDDEESIPRLLGFQVNYCELQAWGPHRCRTKLDTYCGLIITTYTLRMARDTSNNVHFFAFGALNGSITFRSSGAAAPALCFLQSRVVELKNEEDETVKFLDVQTTTISGRRGRSYSTRISGLRMATAYSFEVRPVQRAPRDLADPHSIGKSIIVPTKGFSARATQCLPHASEVEVATGPYFGGRIAVEAIDGGPERCSLQGNPNSAQDAYILRIDHDACGSEVNDTTVATYVIVQENLPILTHSTRRFLVLCTYKPETLTVRAGINLPKANPGDVLQNTKPHLGSVEPYDLDNNELQPARLQATEENGQQGMFGEIALVIFLVMAAFGGIALLIWKMVPQTERDNVSIGTTSSLAGSSIFGRRNRDLFSDRSSIYSISISEKGECGPYKGCNDGDNTSEA